MALICREVVDPGELKEIYRLRYSVYVDEMGRRHEHADHDAKSIVEPLDAEGIQIAAFRGSEGRGDGRRGGAGGGNGGASGDCNGESPSIPLGALRINFTSDRGLARHADLYRLTPDILTLRVMVVTRLVTIPGCRGGDASAGLALAKAAYRKALHEGARVGFIDCSVRMSAFFEWLGFDTVRSFEHPEQGPIAIMKADPWDRARLAMTASPFLPILEEFLEDRLEDRRGR